MLRLLLYDLYSSIANHGGAGIVAAQDTSYATPVMGVARWEGVCLEPSLLVSAAIAMASGGYNARGAAEQGCTTPGCTPPGVGRAASGAPLVNYDIRGLLTALP